MNRLASLALAATVARAVRMAGDPHEGSEVSIDAGPDTSEVSDSRDAPSSEAPGHGAGSAEGVGQAQMSKKEQQMARAKYAAYLKREAEPERLRKQAIVDTANNEYAEACSEKHTLGESWGCAYLFANADCSIKYADDVLRVPYGYKVDLDELEPDWHNRPESYYIPDACELHVDDGDAFSFSNQGTSTWTQKQDEGTYPSVRKEWCRNLKKDVDQDDDTLYSGYIGDLQYVELRCGDHRH